MPWGRGEGGLGTSEKVLCPYPCYELCHDRLTRGMCQLPSVLRAKAFCFINFNIVEAKTIISIIIIRKVRGVGEASGYWKKGP